LDSLLVEEEEEEEEEEKVYSKLTQWRRTRIY